MATANTSGDGMTSGDGKETDYSLCGELFTKPKLLPCSHTFCRHRLLFWLATDPQAPCPIADPKAGSSREGVEDVVDDLPTDRVLEALADSTRLLSKGHACTGCWNNAAVQICLTCGDILCQFCANVHRNMSATCHHKLGNLSSMTPERLAVSRSAYCPVHSDKPAELFCATHAVVMCHLCEATEHRECAEVTLFDKRVEGLRAQLTAMSTKLGTVETELGKAISQLDQRMAEVEVNSQAAVSDIDAECDRLENALKDCRHRLKKQALRDIARDKEKIQAVKDTFVERKEGLTTRRVSVDRIQRAVPSKFLNDVTPKLKSNFKDLDLTAELPSDVKAVCTASLTVDQQALDRLEKELDNLVFGQANEASPEHDVSCDTLGQLVLRPARFASDSTQVSTESSCFDLR